MKTILIINTLFELSSIGRRSLPKNGVNFKLLLWRALTVKSHSKAVANSPLTFKSLSKNDSVVFCKIAISHQDKQQLKSRSDNKKNGQIKQTQPSISATPLRFIHLACHLCASAFHQLSNINSPTTLKSPNAFRVKQSSTQNRGTNIGEIARW